MAVVLQRRTRLRSLSDDFARLVSAGQVDACGPLIGLEHEFQLSIDGSVVDFRTLVHRIGLDVDGAAVDPADPNAYRGTWGGSITADGREAEVTIPPVPIGDGFSAAALGLAHAGRRRLTAAVPDGELAGFSTHLNVSVPRHLGERVARRYARTFAPALMLLLDSTASPGLLVRPRPGRLELGGEFADGDRLRAALVFAAGSVLATIDASGWRGPFARRPRLLRVDLEAAVDRFGWYVDRRAFGPDLYAEGRAAVLKTRRGAPITAQVHLAECWRVARRALRGSASHEELGLVDEFVAGVRPLGLEQPAAEATATAADAGATPVADHGFGAAAIRRERPGMAVEPVVIGWDLVVLRAVATHEAARSAAATYAAVPRSSLARAVAALDRGELDEPLRRAIAASEGDGDRVLARIEQARRPGLFAAMGAARGLVADERAPEVGDRKERRRENEPDRQPPRREDPTRLARSGGAVAVTQVARRGPGWPVAAVAALAVVVLAGGAAALGRIGPFAASTATPSGGVPSASAGASGAPGPSGAAFSPSPGGAAAPVVYAGTWSQTSCETEGEGLCSPVPDLPAEVTLDCDPATSECLLALEVFGETDEFTGLVIANKFTPESPGVLRYSESSTQNQGVCDVEYREETVATYDGARMHLVRTTTHTPRTCSDGTSTLYMEDSVEEFEGTVKQTGALPSLSPRSA